MKSNISTVYTLKNGTKNSRKKPAVPIRAVSNKTIPIRTASIIKAATNVLTTPSAQAFPATY